MSLYYMTADERLCFSSQSQGDTWWGQKQKSKSHPMGYGSETKRLQSMIARI